LSAHGHHSLTCTTGGGLTRWHNETRNWLQRWLGSVTDYTPPIEQVVPQWSRANEGEAGLAVLDIGPFRDRAGRLTFVDVTFGTVTSPETDAGAATAHARAGQDGVKAREMVAGKHRRYPAESFPAAALVPFAIESHGRWSDDALAFVSHILPPDFPDRPAELSRVRRAISVLTQLRLGDLLLASRSPPVVR